MPDDNLTREEAAARARVVSDVRAEIEFDLTTGEDTFGLEALIRFRASEPGDTFLDFVGAAVESVVLNGEPLEDPFDGVRIHLRGMSAENEVRIRATGAYERSGVGLHRFRDPVDERVYVHSDFEPFDAHHAYPCFDQPDLKGVFTFSARVPEGWVAVSNTAPSGEPEALEGGGLRWRFRPTPAVSTYITALVAGEFHHVHARHEDIDLGLYCRASLARYLDADADEIFELTRQGFDFYAQSFDYPYPFGKYDQLFVPEFIPGAMENPGCVTFNEAYLFRSKVTDAARERRAATILHEMAHMWFGDLVTMRWWDDLWLNESFAEFMATFAQVRATRFANGWVTFADSVKTWAYQQDQLPSTHPIVADIPDTLSIRVNFDGITYAKGASVLRQLVAWVGEDAFFQGLRIYFKRHEYGNTTLADFLAALEEASGRDLAAWSREWLETAGVDTLQLAFDGTAGDTFGSTRVQQTAPPAHPVLRSHRVSLGIYDRTADGVVRRSAHELDVTGASTPVPIEEPPAALVLVNDGDLAYAKSRLDPRSLETVRDHLREVTDPLARALCWTSLWDMVRDAELATRDYLPVVLAHAPAESEIGVLQRLLAQLMSAIDAYGDPGNRAAMRAAVSAEASRQAAAAEPGGERQLVWVRAFASTADGVEDLAVLRGLLFGDVPFPGLDVDTDLRWHVVQCLAAAGAIDEALIDAELERDPTSAGRNHAATARAARPDAQAKAEAWDGITHTPPPPVEILEAIIRGFQRFGQAELLAPYLERYFGSVDDLWAGRDRQTGLAFARGLYPRTLVDEATIDASDRYLAEHAPEGPVRRMVLEGRDQIARALRARQRDRAAVGTG